jgi:glycine/D-amino acid oxidase-like deaminating enzyme
MTYEPQPKGIAELERRLKKLYTGHYEVLSASAGVRPTTNDRRPFIGWHPENKAVGIFNGFGTKGVSLVPYFSKLFVDSIEDREKVHIEADVNRVF